jgi:hypothetical protein
VFVVVVVVLVQILMVILRASESNWPRRCAAFVTALLWTQQINCYSIVVDTANCYSIVMGTEN